MQQLRILIWHVHGSYLYYLTQAPHLFYLPSNAERTGDLMGRYGHIPWGRNVVDVPVQEVKNLELDCIIFQLPKQYLTNQHEILSEEQRKLPKIYLEHDPPHLHPTSQKHIVDDPNMLLVHVTNYNKLMWDSGRTPTRVIDHGVLIPEDVRYTGETEKGLVVINHLARRGRIVGADIFEEVRHQVPLDLVGMGAEEAGGLREVLHHDLPAFEARYRFFFNPIRYTSLGLAVCEAMMVGLPIIGLATTEMVTAVQNGVSGYVDTNITNLVKRMKDLLRWPQDARRLGAAARRYALERFNIRRFVRDWNSALAVITGTKVTMPR
jgi:hypothetical protein